MKDINKMTRFELQNHMFSLISEANYNKTLIKLFEHENTTNNLSQRYKPNLFVQLTDIKNKQVFPQQLCFYNAGITPFYSSNLTFTINMSALNGQNYIIPDPSKFQPGVTTTGFVKDSITGEIIKNLTVNIQKMLQSTKWLRFYFNFILNR